MADSTPTHKYSIGKSVAYATRGFGTPGAPLPLTEAITKAVAEQIALRPLQPPAAPAKPAPPAEPLTLPTEKRAAWIVHGMGQQVPFETLDNLATGVLRVAKLVPNHAPRVTAVKFAASSPSEKDQVVERVELDIQDPSDPQKQFQLHLYEAYWAPLTEGASKVTDVISFLFTGGMRGIANTFKTFQRAMFPNQQPPAVPDPGIQNFTIPGRAALEVGVTLLILLSLMAINAVIVAAGAAKAQIPAFNLLTFDQHWPQLTALATATCAVALTFGVILFLAEMCKPANLASWKKLLITIVGWIGLALTAFSIIASAALMTTVTRSQWVCALLHSMNTTAVQLVSNLFLIAAALLVLVALFFRGVMRSSGVALHGNPVLVFLFVLSFLLHLAVIPALIFVSTRELSLPPSLLLIPITLLANSNWVWPALLALSKLLRDLLVEYAGDVAIYVDSNKLDRFDKIRKAIKQVAMDSVMGIYTARNADDSAFEYSKIAVVGHSLGSVIAYDTLNELLNLDDIGGHPVGIAGRTCLLETFGSPLDKIAFFFTIQGTQTFHIREQLAAVVQPLIQDYVKFRKFPWINVYSRSDIISGSLKFYDVPGIAIPPGVQNLPDKDAVVPLVAHVDYWKNDLVWQQLLQHSKP
jgi:hypothetical protein